MLLFIKILCLQLTLKFAAVGPDCKDDMANAAFYVQVLGSLSVIEELPTAVCHLYAEIVRKLFVLDYLSSPAKTMVIFR